MERVNEAIRVGHCKYCGAPAETGSGGLSSDVCEHFDLLCMTCSEDFAEFARRPENATPNVVPGDKEALRKAAAQLADLVRQRDEFIRRRVLQRKSKR